MTKWRKLRPGETDIELWFGVVLLSLCGIGAFISVILPRGWIPPCRLHQTTGLPCPTCGSHRAIRALINGDILTALHSQPLGTALIAGAAIFWLYALTTVIFKLPRFRPDISKRSKRLICYGLLIAILLNWIYLLIAGI
jgi:hypothetical protein